MHRQDLPLLVEMLLAQIALLQAGNEVLRRTNAKLVTRLGALPTESGMRERRSRKDPNGSAA